MEMKAFPAFGYVVLRSVVEASEIVDDDTLADNTYVSDDNFVTVWLQVDGLATHTNDSGQTQTRVAGDSTISKPLMPGRNSIVFNERTTTFCVGPTANRNKSPKVPPLQHFAIKAGDSVVMPSGAKLFLASGAIEVGGLRINGTRQISFSSGEKLCTAVEDSLGLIFV